MPGKKDTQEIEDKIVEIINYSEEPINAVQLSEEFGIEEKDVAVLLRKLLKNGLISLHHRSDDMRKKYYGPVEAFFHGYIPVPTRRIEE